MFDIGVNLTSSQFAKDRDDVVACAFDAGVNGLLITGTNLRESQQAQKLARQYSSCWSTAGVHPHDSFCACRCTNAGQFAGTEARNHARAGGKTCCGR